MRQAVTFPAVRAAFSSKCLCKGHCTPSHTKSEGAHSSAKHNHSPPVLLVQRKDRDAMLGTQNTNRALWQHPHSLTCKRSTSISPWALGSSTDWSDKWVTGRDCLYSVLYGAFFQLQPGTSDTVGASHFIHTKKIGDHTCWKCTDLSSISKWRMPSPRKSWQQYKWQDDPYYSERRGLAFFVSNLLTC